MNNWYSIFEPETGIDRNVSAISVVEAIRSLYPKCLVRPDVADHFNVYDGKTIFIVQTKLLNSREVLTRMLNEQLDRSIISGEGFTMTRDGYLDKEFGYVVGITDQEIGDDNRTELLEKAVEYLLEENVGEVRTVGFWYDSEKDACFFDLGEYWTMAHYAMKVAKRHGQRAIWSISHEMAIPVNYPKGGLN